jgi:hypothetical protein
MYHYLIVVKDLEAMKADAENGIKALRRLMSGGSGENEPAIAPRVSNGRAPGLTTTRILR